MALFPQPGTDPRQRFAQMLAFYGSLGDAASGYPRGFGPRKASIAVALATLAEIDEASRDAIGFAGLLHAIGAIAHHEEPRDVPVYGARLCERIAALPPATAELVRTQSESWDGTGFPDQLRWHAIPFAAQLLLLSHSVLMLSEEDALDRVNAESGRSLSPAAVALYARWLRLGEKAAPLEPPWHALDPGACDMISFLTEITDEMT